MERDSRSALSTPPSVRLFATDLDGTLLGIPDSTERFRRAWRSLPSRGRPLMVYNSGRLVADQRRLLCRGWLDEPDYLIGGVGTEIFDLLRRCRLGAFEKELGERWELALVEEILRAQPGIEQQPSQFLNSHKSSWYLRNAGKETILEIVEKLACSGLAVNVIYSSRRDLDVVPARANKGNALAWLCNHLGVSLGSAVVAGDTSNDTSMFRLPKVRGIAVANALEQLREETSDLPVFRALRPMADGVIEGLQHFGVFMSERVPRLQRF